MKKLLSCVLAVVSIFMLTLPALAAEGPSTPESPSYTIIVSGNPVVLDDLPCQPYYEGDTLMVPLRKISEALGYRVDWDAETGAITVDDEYIQKATLFGGTASVVFHGHLQVIDMSREIENAAVSVIHDGVTFVPLEFFQEFFNDVTVTGTEITVAPSMNQLDGV